MADTLLLVDADADVRRAIGDSLERVGYEVRRAATGQQGLAAFERDRPDVVIVDVDLPDSSGLVVLERVRALGGAVILLTRSGDQENAVRGMELGAETFVTKPVDLTHLGAAAARVAEKARLARENARLRAQIGHTPQALAEVEREHIERTLRAHGGNRTRAAQELGISRATLINKIRVYRLDL
ncbi:MAG TPA: response regulator [Gemmatimonadales bacterium]|nr:response regulator [Gemmatimonadales bacterium]